MQDTISKNTGNSRTLASVPNFLTLYPTYESFAQALIDRTLPIDLGPLNPAGLAQRGTDLNKNNLLKDTTAALYGKTSTAAPDDIFVAIRTLIQTAQTAANARARIETGTYIGTGQSGADHPNSLTFSFPPTIVMFVGARSTGSGVTPDNTSSASVPYLENFSDHGYSVIAMIDLLTSYMQFGPAATVDLGTGQSLRAWAKRSTDGRTLTWYTEIRDNNWELVPVAPNDSCQYNADNKKYRYVAIG